MAIQFKSATGFDYVSAATPLPVTIVGGGTGDVDGPSSATDNAVVRFDGATGKIIKNSVLIVANTTGALSGFTTGVGITFHGGGTITGASGALTITGALTTGAISSAAGSFSGILSLNSTNYHTVNSLRFLRSIADFNVLFLGPNGLNINNQADDAGIASFTSTGLAVTGSITSSDTATLIKKSGTLANGAAAQVGTLTNAPSAGNPTKWVAIDDNGTTRHIPCW